jgi:hypothetical protein
MTDKNEFKFSTLRNFGSEQFSFSAIIHSEKTTLTDMEIADGIKQIDTAISKAFKSCSDREIGEMAVLAENSERRATEIKKRDDALKAEMKVKEDATKTLKQAETLSDKITKKQNA